DLHYELTQLYANQRSDKTEDSFRECTVYRGQRMYLNEFEEIKGNIGGLISMNSFLSTSKHRRLAEMFTGPGSEDSLCRRILFEIVINPRLCELPCFGDISELSSFPSEQEVLFFPGSIFRIESVKDLSDNMQHIQLTLIDKENQQYKLLTQYWNTCIGERSILRETRENQLFVRDLTIDSAQFLGFQLLMDMILRLDQTYTVKQEMLEACQLRYKNDSYSLREINEFERTYKSEDAVTWYTRDGFLHRLLNESLRMENIDLIFKLRYFIYDLHNQINELYYNARSSSTTKDQRLLTLYRGQTMSIKDLEDLRQNINCLVSMNSFLSTTNDREAAIFFSGDGITPDISHVSVLYEIEIDTTIESTTPYAKVDYQSIFRDESEVLFTMGSVFRIRLVQEIKERLWNVTLTLTNKHDENWSKLTEHLD
ncbi:unnamed protein product, partial [Didymodactylos carnosus]